MFSLRLQKSQHILILVLIDLKGGLLIAKVVLLFSPDGCNLQVGACIVNSEKKIVGIGYNGMPNGCSDDKLPWKRVAKDRLDTKYPYGKKTRKAHLSFIIVLGA